MIPKLTFLFRVFAFLMLTKTLHYVSADTPARIKLFQDKQFSMLLLDWPLDTAECVSLPTYIQEAAGSLYTQTCILVYMGIDCTEKSIKIDPLNIPKYYNLYEVKHSDVEHFGRRVKSYKRCSPDNGGDLLHVDFYSAPGKNDITYTYPDICGCMNIPSLSSDLGSLHKIDNHGNCVKLYTGLDCSGDEFEIQGGRSQNSENVDLLASSIYSVSPCGDYSNGCVSLSALVVKFELLLDETKASTYASNSQLSMTANTVFRNNGSATVAQTYSARKLVKETHETYTITGSKSMHQINVAMGLQLESEAKIPLIAKTKITFSLNAAYTYQKESSKEEGEKFIHEEEVEYIVDQRIEIPACSTYEVNSYVNLVNGSSTNYKVTYHVTGKDKNGILLTASEVKQSIGSLEYVGDYDDKTVIATAYGNIVSNFGLEAVIDGEGAPISNCQQKMMKG